MCVCVCVCVSGVCVCVIHHGLENNALDFRVYICVC